MVANTWTLIFTLSLLILRASSNQRLPATPAVVTVRVIWWAQSSYYWRGFFTAKALANTWPLTVRGHRKPQTFTFPPALRESDSVVVRQMHWIANTRYSFSVHKPRGSAASNSSQSSSFNEPCNWWKRAQSCQIKSPHWGELPGKH